MLNIITAPEGMVYQGKSSGIICRTLILGVTDSIANYELIPEPVEEEEAAEPDNGDDIQLS